MDTNGKNSNQAINSASGCPMVDFVNIVSGKWAIPILYRLIVTNDMIRFGELRRAIGPITQKELTKQLRSFEKLGLVMRTVYPEMPPRVEYCVTDLGRTLKPTLDSLAHWMTEHREQLIQESPPLPRIR